MIFILVMILSSLTNGTIHAQKQSLRCNIAVVREMDEGIKTGSKELVYRFLCSFDSSCSTNVEYSQYSNEVLFKVLEMHTSIFMQCLKRPEVDREYVFQRLSEPLVYEDVKQLKEIVSKARGDAGTKRRILTALENAE